MTPPGGVDPLSFADQAYRGKNAPWRVLIALALILPGTYLSAFLIALAYFALGFGDALQALAAPAEGLGLRVQLLAFAFLMLSIIVMLPLMRLVLPWLHRRPWLSFITARPRFGWALYARSFGAMLGLCLAGLGLTLWLSPGELRWIADWRALALFVPLALVTLPLQVMTEEIFFRGYLMQLTSRLLRPWLLRLLLPALLFAAAHSANPEARYDYLWASANYLLLALYLGLISFKGGGLEASAGAHLGVNIYAALIVGSPISVSPGPTLWLSGPPDFKVALFQTLPLLAFHYILVFRPQPNNGRLTRKIWPSVEPRQGPDSQDAN